MRQAICAVCVGLAAWWLAIAGGRAAGWEAGAAVVDITPPTGYALWGYASRHDAPSVGVLDPLRARALVLAAGRRRIALVSLDLGRPPTRQSFAAIRARVKPAGIEQLAEASTHGTYSLGR